ncbi:unnamed protein product [Prunus armeniaca]
MVHTESSTDLPMGFKLNGSNYEDAVNQMFYDGSNISQLYELRCQAARLKQEGHPISTYFAELKAIWLELDKGRLFQILGLGPQLNATVMRLDLSRKVPNTSFGNWSVMHV